MRVGWALAAGGYDGIARMRVDLRGVDYAIVGLPLARSLGRRRDGGHEWFPRPVLSVGGGIGGAGLLDRRRGALRRKIGVL